MLMIGYFREFHCESITGFLYIVCLLFSPFISRVVCLPETAGYRPSSCLSLINRDIDTHLIEMDARLNKYEKIDFLGEGQVNTTCVGNHKSASH